MLANSKQTSSDSFEFASLPDSNFRLGCIGMDVSGLFESELSSSVFLSATGSMKLREMGEMKQNYILHTFGFFMICDNEQ